MNEKPKASNLSNLRTWSTEKDLRQAQRSINQAINEMLQASKDSDPHTISQYVPQLSQALDDVERMSAKLVALWTMPERY